MIDFKVHFLKFKSRHLDQARLVSVLKKLGRFEYEVEGDNEIMHYVDPNFDYNANFSMSKISKIERINDLNPNYKDVNFRLSFPMSVPIYFASKLFDMVSTIVNELDLHIYTDFCEDVSEFNHGLLLEKFRTYKNAYRQKNYMEFENYYEVNENKLSTILKYIDDSDQLEEHYKIDNVYVPRYHFLKDQNNKFVLAIEWNEQRPILIPPYVDYIFYRKAQEIKTLYAREVLDVLDNYVDSVSGFSREAKIIGLSNLKKVSKIMYKTNFNKVDGLFSKILLENLTD